MHKFLKIAFTAISLLFFFVTAALAGEECAPSAACVATFGDPAPAKESVDDMVCVWFTQKHAGNVMIVLYENPPTGEEHEGSKVLFEKTRWHPARSKYCFGRWRLEGVVWMLVCNDSEHATRGIPSITRLREDGDIDLCSLSAGCT